MDAGGDSCDVRDCGFVVMIYLGKKSHLLTEAGIAFGLGINKRDVRFVMHHTVCPFPLRLNLITDASFDRCRYVYQIGVAVLPLKFSALFARQTTLEQYFQESGRAGRDNLPSACILYHKAQDAANAAGLIKTGQSGLNDRALFSHSQRSRC